MSKNKKIGIIGNDKDKYVEFFQCPICHKKLIKKDEASLSTWKPYCEHCDEDWIIKINSNELTIEYIKSSLEDFNKVV